jgi:hypothetical protein
MKRIKNLFMAILEGIQEAKSYKAKGFAEYYLSQSVDHKDLENKQQELVRKGML